MPYIQDSISTDPFYLETRARRVYPDLDIFFVLHSDSNLARCQAYQATAIPMLGTPISRVELYFDPFLQI